LKFVSERDEPDGPADGRRGVERVFFSDIDDLIGKLLRRDQRSVSTPN